MICSDIYCYVISRAVRRVKFETFLKYHEWYLCQISRTNHAIICLYCYMRNGTPSVYFVMRILIDSVQHVISCDPKSKLITILIANTCKERTPKLIKV